MTTEIEGLPRWVWDVLADLARYEAIHGKDWHCLDATWERVPADVRMVAAVIAEYRIPDAEIVEETE